MNDDQNPDLAAVIREALISRLASLHTALPARVVSFESGPPAVVTVEIGVDFHRRDEDGARERYTPPQLANVPVIYPGAGKYSITYPLFADDTVLLVFCERSIADWLRDGGSGVEPQHARRHALTDAVAIPGLRPRNDDVPANGHAADALVLRGDKIKLGATATKGVNRQGDEVKAKIGLSLFSAVTAAAITAIKADLATLGLGAGVTAPTPISTGDVVGETSTGSGVVTADD